MPLFVRALGIINRCTLRGVGLAGALACVAMGFGAQAQQSSGPTSYHLTAVNNGDLTGKTITGIASEGAVPRTDGKTAFFVTGSTNGACGTQLLAMPIAGGSVSTLMSPSMKFEPQQSGGTSAGICDLTLGGSNVYYSAFYTPSTGIERIGIFKVPLTGGASSDVIAGGDAVQPFVPGVTPTGTPTVGFVSTSQFSIDPTTGSLLDYYQATEWSGSTSYVSDFNTYLLNGSPELMPATSSCPGVTVQGSSSYYPVSTDGTIYATTISGTGTNYAGATKPMSFLMIGRWPFAGGCAGVAFGPTLGSMAGGGNFILPGLPAGATSTPAQQAILSNPEVSNGVVYVTAFQGFYGGIFVAANNFGSNPNGSRGTFPLANGQWPANLNPIPTKIIGNYDPIPGITLGLAPCPGGFTQTPNIQSEFTAAGSFVVFEENQTLQNCSTMATTQAGGIYAYNLTTNTVQPVALYGATLAAGDSPVTALGLIFPGSLSADGHLVFTAGTTPAGSTAQTSVLYSAYLNQVISTVSLAAPSTVFKGNQFTLTATVTNNQAAPNGVAATGTVQFFDGTIPLGPQVALSSSGTATYTKSTSSAGPRNFHAVYSGDALYEGATSAATPVMVLNPSPTLGLSASSTSSAVGQGIVLTAQASSGAGGYPTGQVVFTGGSVTLGTSTIGPTGLATLTVSTLPVGTTTVFATYTGDANFSGATSPNVAITVGAPDYTITVAPPSATITAGQTTTFVFTVTPVFGFSLPVTFSCGALPAEVTCTFAPPTVTPGTGPVSSTLTIATTAPRVASNEAPRSLLPRGGGVAGVCLAMLFAWLPRRVRQRRGWTVFVLLGMLGVGMLSISGCSGGSSAGGSGGTNDPGTTKGSATVAVSASAGSGSGAVSHSAAITVVIQ